MAVATRLQKRLNEVIVITMEMDQIETNEPELPTLNKLISEKSTDSGCDRAGPTVRTPRPSFNFDKDGLLLRRLPIDAAIQKVVLQ